MASCGHTTYPKTRPDTNTCWGKGHPYGKQLIYFVFASSTISSPMHLPPQGTESMRGERQERGERREWREEKGEGEKRKRREQIRLRRPVRWIAMAAGAGTQAPIVMMMSGTNTPLYSV